MKRLTLFMSVILFVGGTMLQAAQTITLNLRQVKMEDVFSQISQQTSLVFDNQHPSINSTLVEKVEVKDMDVRSTLNQVFAGTDISYQISGSKVLLTENSLSTKQKEDSKITIKGTVKDDQGEGLFGSSVTEKNTLNAVMTDIDGNYTITVSQSAILVFTYLGFNTQEIATSNREVLNVTLLENSRQLDEVVVTALGIKREKKSLGYALQEVKGSDLLETRDANIANSLTGKIAGLDVRSSPTGPGGSSRIVLRGNSSIGGNNQPLIVVDGVPINSGTGSDNDDYFGERLMDRGSGMADISPDDIETMSVLKGPAAAALYGSRAGAGVIMITTKTGKGTKGVGVSYSTNLTIDAPMTKPRLQNKYGQGSQGVIDLTRTDGRNSWGAPIEGQTYTDYTGNRQLKYEQGANVKDFLRTGTTWTNSLDVNKATDDTSIRMGINHTSNRGVVPNNEFQRTSATVRGTANLTKKLSVDSKITYIHQKTDNRIKLGANHDNIFNQFLIMPRSVRLSDFVVGNDLAYHAQYRGIINNYAWARGVTTAGTDPEDLSGRPVSYINPASGNTANPYFSTLKNTNNDRKNRFIGLASAKYEFASWLSLQGRYGIDHSSSRYQDIQSAGTVFSSYSAVNGNVMVDEAEGYEMNTDILLSFNKNFMNDRVGVVVTTGGNYMYQRNDGLFATANGLEYEYFYSLSNALDPQTSQSTYRKKQQSAYGTASFSLDNTYYLDFTARNDWSSALNSRNRSYFYPSVSASWLFSETFKNQLGPINYGKIRVSWAEVGNDTDAYRLHNYQSIILGNPSPSTVMANYDLKNERVSSYEVGLELAAFNNRLGIDFAFYNNETKDQILDVPISPTQGYYKQWMNAGKMQNKGIELLLRGTPIQIENFEWNTTLNFSRNKNKILSLHPDLPEMQLSHQSYASMLVIKAVEGGQYGDMWGRKFLRNEEGQLILGSDGLPQSAKEMEKLGNASPKWMGGITNHFRYKDFDLSFQIDIRYGGKVFMGSMQAAAAAGTLDITEANRAIGSLQIEGVDASGNPVTKDSYAQEYWQKITGGNTPVAEPWIKDATNIRLRELSFGYTIPKSILQKTFIKSAKMSFVGRNLWMIHSKVKGFDPEAGFSTGNAQGFEYGSMPTLRSLGFNINVTF